jgi:hypothetical protein
MDYLFKFSVRTAEGYDACRELQKNFGGQELSYVRNSGRRSRAKGMCTALHLEDRAVFATLDANRDPSWRCSGTIAGDAQAVRLPRGSIGWAPHARPHRSAQCGFVLCSATVCERETANNRLPPRVLTDGGKSRRPDQAALPSVAVAAAARRSTLPSGPRGTASTAHSRSGVL